MEALKEMISGDYKLCFAIGGGLLLIFLVALMLYSLLRRRRHSEDIEPDDIIGRLGTVYLCVPCGRSEVGKVVAEVKGTSQEIIAVADEEIPRGCSVKILEQIDDNRFLVEKAQVS